MTKPSAFPSDARQRERADGEMLRQKTYLDELFELAPDAVVLTTLRNPRILRINREFTRIFGYTPEEAVGNSLRNLVVPDGLEAILPEDPDLLAGRKVEWEVIRRRKDGTRLHAHITGKRIKSSDDEDAAYLIFRDVSARKQADALFEGEKRLLEIIAAGGPLTTTLDALCRLAEDVDRSSMTSILLVDCRGKQLLHGAAPSLLPSYVNAVDGAPVGLGIGPCAAAAHLGEQVISLDLAADERWSDEIRALMSAHGLRSCWSTPIKSSEGRVLGTFAIFPREPAAPTAEQRSTIEQLTHLASIAIERAQSMDALRRSEERYALAMEAAADGHMDWNLVTGEFYISPRMLRMVGHAPDDTFVDRADWVRRFPFHPEDRPRWEAAIAAHFAGREARFRGDFRIVVNGETRWLAFTFIATRDAAGKVVRWTGSITDLSDAKRDVATVVESIPGLVAILTPAGELDAVNDQLAEYCGQPLEAMKQWGTNGTVHTEDLPRVVEIFMRGISTGEPYEFEARVRRFDGAYRWNQIRGHPSRDSDGQIVRWYSVIFDIDDRKRAEEALRVSEDRYALALEASEEGHYDIDLQTGKIFVSARVNEIYGFPAQAETLKRGEFFARIPFHPDDRPRVLAEVSKPDWNDRNLHEVQCRIVPRPGETRWTRSRAKVVRDAQGRAVRRVGVLADITERKRAEDELRESEARFRALTALWSDWYWRQDEHLCFTYSTAAIDPPDGYPGGSAIGKTRWELPDAVPLSSSWAEHRKLLAARKPFRDFEYSRPAGDGTLRYLSTSGTPIFNDKGEFRGYHGVARNITERKRFEEELRSRQEMLEVAQKAARAAAFEWRVGAGEGENRWSPDLEAMHGIPAGSYDGTFESWKKMVHPEDWPNVEGAITIAQQSGDVGVEYRVLFPGGAVRWLQAIGRMFFDPEGRPARIVGFMLDVTDRHLAEEELQQMERQLRQAQRLEALGTLAGGIAHDFNNLLGAILGYGEMALRNVRAGSRLRRDIENMMIAGERGHALVERILAFSRSGVGERVAVHVEKVARETLALFAAKLPRHIAIERRLRAGSAAVMGDPTQIHQVLMNLLTNAVQAMPSTGALRVSLDRLHFQAPRVVTTGSIGAREYVVMEVSDSGSGISPEVLEKIFDPFFTTKEVGVGTGLGLSLVHGIVTGLGGAIDVATTVGKGSVFAVYLPSAGDATVPSKPRKRPEPKTRRAGRGRVLVIDDEEVLVRLVSETLTRLGYSAVGFTAGAKALEAFLADPEHFDAVITDESMPGASGSDLIRKMRTLRPTLPILLVSGYLNAAVIERAREAGATEVLKKPLPARQLQVALERALPPRRSQSENDVVSSSTSVAKPRRRVGTSRSPSGSARRGSR